jgi:GLPGLI family protein
MKPYIIVIFALLSSLWAYAQELSGVIKYRYLYSKEALPKDSRTVGNYVSDFNLPAYLYFNTNKSLFDYDKLQYSHEVKYDRKYDEHGQMYFIDKKSGMLYFREFIYRGTYISQEKIPVITWELKNEVKTIAEYVCKKATAEFRGRKYTAWYTSSIPVSIGPWKLQGLPGAILEAETEDGQVKFIAESIRIPADVQKELSLKELPDGKVVTFDEYLEAFEKERKAVETFFETLFTKQFEEKVKQGEIKADLNSLKFYNSRKMFTIEKYE